MHNEQLINRMIIISVVVAGCLLLADGCAYNRNASLLDLSIEANGNTTTVPVSTGL